jgi:hypothetical protein
MQNMETLSFWASRVVATPTARRGSRRSIGTAEEAKAGV